MTLRTRLARRREISDEEYIVCGMDVPCGPWTAEDAAFWTGTARYQPWRDVAAFFRDSTPCDIVAIETPCSDLTDGDLERARAAIRALVGDAGR